MRLSMFRFKALLALICALPMTSYGQCDQSPYGEPYSISQSCDPCDPCNPCDPCAPCAPRRNWGTGAVILTGVAAGIAGGAIGAAVGHRKGHKGRNGRDGNGGGRGATGARGPRGPAGDTGATGPAGPGPFVTDTGESLSFIFNLTLGIVLFPAAPGIVPFVSTPDGRVLTTTPFDPSLLLLQTRTIIVTDPVFGTYHMGLLIPPSLAAVALSLNNFVFASRNGGSLTAVPLAVDIAVPLGVQTQVQEEYTYGPTGTVPIP
jgi:hypothetical protein